MGTNELKLNIMVVDDDQATRVFLHRLIDMRFGHNVIEATDGLHGLKILDKIDIDMVLLDLSMPIMSGQEFLSTLRLNAKYKNIPILIFTALKTEQSVKELLEFDIKDYILKPLDTEETYKRLKNCITNLTPLFLSNRAKLNTDFKIKLLLVDEDEQFHTEFKNIFNDKFDLIEGTSGADCLKTYLDIRPNIVLIGDNLGVVNETVVAKKIRQFDKGRYSKIFFCSQDCSGKNFDKDLFDGMFQKGLTPDSFEKEFFEKIND